MAYLLQSVKSASYLKKHYVSYSMAIDAYMRCGQMDTRDSPPFRLNSIN